MNDQERTSILPTILVAILALFGLATIPQGQGKRPEGTEASAKASVEGAEHKSEVKKPNRPRALEHLEGFLAELRAVRRTPRESITQRGGLRGGAPLEHPQSAVPDRAGS